MVQIFPRTRLGITALFFIYCWSFFHKSIRHLWSLLFSGTKIWSIRIRGKPWRGGAKRNEMETSPRGSNSLSKQCSPLNVALDLCVPSVSFPCSQQLALRHFGKWLLASSWCMLMPLGQSSLWHFLRGFLTLFGL